MKRARRALALLAAIAALWLGARIVWPRQTDDREALRRKQAYLERIRSIAGSLPATPNLVLILFDDLGPGDLGAYGGRAVATPWLDRLAGEGARFAQAYSTSPYCSASRAGLLTGRYPVRSGLDHVLQAPWTWTDLLLRLGARNRRLPADEITLAEVLAAAGYATAIYGKWHLGDEPPALPGDLGFGSFYGLLHSNDQGRPAVWRDREIVERQPIDQSTLTRRYTAEAVAFVEAHRERPFFLYLPHTFPHVPLAAAPERRGRSDAGLYGDVVEELDDSVGRVLTAVDRLGLAERTLVLVTSDNGPWFEGSTGGARGRKLDVFEGGLRVPLLARWPGRIPAGGVVETPVMGLDVFPTALELLGLPAPADREIDGESLVALLDGVDAGRRRPLLFFQLGVLRAVRDGRFKYHDRHRVPFGNPMDWPWGPTRRVGPWLFDLELDPGESYDVSERHPETARRLAALLEARRRGLASNPRGWIAPVGAEGGP